MREIPTLSSFANSRSSDRVEGIRDWGLGTGYWGIGREGRQGRGERQGRQGGEGSYIT